MPPKLMLSNNKKNRQPYPERSLQAAVREQLKSLFYLARINGVIIMLVLLSFDDL